MAEVIQQRTYTGVSHDVDVTLQNLVRVVNALHTTVQANDAATKKSISSLPTQVVDVVRTALSAGGSAPLNLTGLPGSSTGGTTTTPTTDDDSIPIAYFLGD